MITGKFVTDKEKLDLAGMLRAEIFQGRYVTDSFPCPEARYAVLWVDGVPVGMGGICCINDRTTIIEVGVLEEHRKEYYGDFLLRLLASPAFDEGIRKIYVNATEDSRGFFAAMHFRPEEGAAYGYTGRERYPMVLARSDLRCACSKNRSSPYMSV